MREVVNTHQPAARSQSVSAHSPFPRGRSFIRRLNLLRLINLKPKAAGTSSYEVSIGGCPQFSPPFAISYAGDRNSTDPLSSARLLVAGEIP
jgi:hypothetical protein